MNRSHYFKFNTFVKVFTMSFSWVPYLLIFVSVFQGIDTKAQNLVDTLYLIESDTIEKFQGKHFSLNVENKVALLYYTESYGMTWYTWVLKNGDGYDLNKSLKNKKNWQEFSNLYFRMKEPSLVLNVDWINLEIVSDTMCLISYDNKMRLFNYFPIPSYGSLMVGLDKPEAGHVKEIDDTSSVTFLSTGVIDIFKKSAEGKSAISVTNGWFTLIYVGYLCEDVKYEIGDIITVADKVPFCQDSFDLVITLNFIFRKP